MDKRKPGTQLDTLTVLITNSLGTKGKERKGKEKEGKERKGRKGKETSIRKTRAQLDIVTALYSNS